MGGNAVTKFIVNGLVREAQNLRRVGAYGDPSRYHKGAYDRMQEEWLYLLIQQIGWYRRSEKLLSL